MSIDLFCYTTLQPDELKTALLRLEADRNDLFSGKFLISGGRGTDSMHKEIALEHGLLADSFFMVSLNEKSAANLVLEVVAQVKAFFGEGKAIILHNNETLM